jgi:hypothetical protein
VGQTCGISLDRFGGGSRKRRKIFGKFGKILEQRIPIALKNFFLFIYSHVHTLFESFLPPAPCLIPLPSNLHPHFQAEPVLPLTLILLKRKHKQ